MESRVGNKNEEILNLLKVIKTKLDSETYNKIGHPDLGNIMYIKRGGKKIYGKVSFLSFAGFKGAKNGLVLIGIEPFKKN